MKPNFVRQKNRHVAVDNIAEILAEIRTAYSTVTLKSIAQKVGVKEATIKRWQREKIARRAEAEALVAAYPVPPPLTLKSSENLEVVNVPCRVLTELFTRIDGLKAAADSLRTQIGVGGK
jgi:hypothetical protein